MDDIVEAYVNPELPPEEMGSQPLTNKVKEFVYLLQDLEPQQLAVCRWRSSRPFCMSSFVSATTSKKRGD